MMEKGTTVYMFDGSIIRKGILGEKHPTLDCYYVTCEDCFCVGRAKQETRLSIKQNLYSDLVKLEEAVYEHIDFLRSTLKDFFDNSNK